jgi:hypothetical protein
MDRRPLRPGDVVEVKSAAEILATLDGEASVDKMPFMPEMLQYVGRRFTVSRRVDKICDTITYTGSRRMHDAVYLENLRCDGSGHAGCQGGCMLYWKEHWLRRVEDGAAPPKTGDPGAGELQRLAASGARTTRSLDGVPTEVWRCQATEAVKATEQLKVIDPSQYWRELTNGNFGPLRFVRLLVRAVVLQVADRLGLLPKLPLHGPGTQSSSGPSQRLGLKPGDLVQVRSPEEIVRTLDDKGLDRGLSFDREMLPFCGKTFRVRDRVERLVDDKSGRLLNIRRDCIILEGVVCSGERSVNCWYCPRQIYAYWRESWLRPVELSDQPNSANAAEPPVLQVGKH